MKCRLLSLYESVTQVSHLWVDSQSMPAKRRNKTMETPWRILNFLCFLFSICLDLALIICQPHRIFLLAFISNVDFIPHFLVISCRWITVFHSVLWNGNSLPPLIPLCLSCSFSDHGYAFSSERKKSISSELKNGPWFLLAPNAVLNFLNKEHF